VSTQTLDAKPSFKEFDQRAQDGERLTVVFFGGSLTWGSRSSDPQKTSYRALVGRKLQEKYPKAHFNFVDASIGGTGAQLGAFRMDRDVLAYDPDLLFLDFTLNDNAYRTCPDTLAAQEAIIRRTIIESKAPVIQMFLAAQAYMTEKNLDEMKRRTAHIKIAQAYNVPCGDAVVLMRDKYLSGQLKLDEVWPPEYFDTCHPCDKGYEYYAQAAWEALSRAIEENVICHVPDKMLHGDRYMHVLRFKLSSLPSLPDGWRTTYPSGEYCAFDFLMTRWVDDVTIASNYLPVTRLETKSITPAKPLKLGFKGSTVLFWGQATPRSGDCRVIVDGDEQRVNFQQLGEHNTGRMWKLVAQGLNPDQEHTLHIIPDFSDSNEPLEIGLESICIAGGQPVVRLESEKIYK
jgi:lysophospholipase L1-like esterase